jgi:TetR/AcrR family transcriptional regulator, transcriptional repressor for nem operon
METANYIIEKVAPLFNRQGYVGTSLADMTNATGLTKGAIYGNFANKEEIALKAFDANIKMAIIPLFKKIDAAKTNLEKLKLITSYQREYFHLVNKIGGCPLMRVGVDAKYNIPKLYEKAKRINERLLNGIANIIVDGVLQEEFYSGAENENYHMVILSIIEGSSFLSFNHQDPSIISKAMDYIDNHIIPKLINK